MLCNAILMLKQVARREGDHVGQEGNKTINNIKNITAIILLSSFTS